MQASSEGEATRRPEVLDMAQFMSWPWLDSRQPSPHGSQGPLYEDRGEEEQPHVGGEGGAGHADSSLMELTAGH